MVSSENDVWENLGVYGKKINLTSKAGKEIQGF
jgi:hypothetical protein